MKRDRSQDTGIGADCRRAAQLATTGAAALEAGVALLERQLAGLLRVHGPVPAPGAKRWYSTAELAGAMGVTV